MRPSTPASTCRGPPSGRGNETASQGKDLRWAATQSTISTTHQRIDWAAGVKDLSSVPAKSARGQAIRGISFAQAMLLICWILRSGPIKALISASLTTRFAPTHSAGVLVHLPALRREKPCSRQGELRYDVLVCAPKETLI